ncbi:NAD(P)/FAD-dependent oxidoreductase [Rhodococcus opacus]|uniref:NAD(P)/FAD-dependent oxidoreductase n=1 Tax=Rhodococcus opacus TaxID=37919 RepID=UPI0011417618|nr:FAD-dependent oxidoreductase [Rhodococcus opacus]MDJ0419726.1 FAD-dependent oxidoreductase [Rhodococcus opacus]MDV6245207.1 FAD-dependent oxidoreductase [Rhodococcus opacus]TQC45862.1 pyridine nucleotide-disulfide oxidoreductase [Rhodococcus sp. WS4]
MSDRHLLVIGNGCGGTEAAFAARTSGWEGPITLLGDERFQPYHRPPLSKAYLKGEVAAESLHLRGAVAYEKNQITVHAGHHAREIDREHRKVAMSDGTEIGYDELVLATGGRPRTLPVADALPQKPSNLYYLRTRADADALRGELQPQRTVVIVGAGYIGLEVAAAAVKAGMTVIVLEAASRVLARVTAQPVSEYYESVHREAGVNIVTDCLVEGLETTREGGRIEAVRCSDGTRLAADLVIVGIGLIPNSELAAAAGLEVDDGIVVDDDLRTTDPHIMAVGDCVRQYSHLYDRYVRVESVPNALEQARKAAAVLCDKPTRPNGAPWFWSDQYDLNLKMVGLSEGYDRLVIRGRPDDRSFSAFYVVGDRVLAVDTINRPADFNISKRLIAERIPVAADLLAASDISLRDLVNSAQPSISSSTARI